MKIKALILNPEFALGFWQSVSKSFPILRCARKSILAVLQRIRLRFFCSHALSWKRFRPFFSKPNAKSGFNEKRFLITIFIIALTLRLAFLIVYQNQKLLHNEYFEEDADVYIYMADSIILHEKPNLTELRGADYPVRLIGIGYPVFLASAFKLFGKNLIIIRIIQALFGALTCIFLYWLGKEISGIAIGAFSAIILVFEPFHIYRTGSILTEVLFVFLLTASLLFLHKGLFSKKLHTFVLGNIFLVLAGFCRAGAFGLYPFILLWASLNLFKTKWVMVKYVVCALLFFFLFIYSWKFIVPKLYAQEHAGNVSDSARKVDFFHKILIPPVDLFMSSSSDAHLGINRSEYHVWRAEIYNSIKDLPILEAQIKMVDEFCNFARRQPALILKIVLQKFINFWRIFPHGQESGKRFTEFGEMKFKIISLASYGIILPFFILGFIIQIPQWKKIFLFYSLIFIFVCIHILYCSQIRYRLQIIPCIIIFASFGLIRFVNFINSRLNINQIQE